jgi:3-hydroxyisobutyrate dehydrogenase
VSPTIGFVGLGRMGSAMVGRLLATGHSVVVFDLRAEAVAAAVEAGARAAADAREVADRTETVLASLPTPQTSLAVAEQIAAGSAIRRFVDLSTVGPTAARQVHDLLGTHGVAALDCPVSGGVHGAAAGTLALMVSGPRTEFESLRTVLEALGRPFLVGEAPGAGQTMKLVNNMLAATTLAATAEAVVMGVRAGLDPAVMIEVLNAGSGGTHASRDKFPRAVLPRTFDYGFAAGLMAKDMRLYLEEARSLRVPTEIAAAIDACWRATVASQGADADFTTVIRPLEDAAGVIVDGRVAADDDPHRR